ncbi:hypothetical protein H4F99_09725 [Lysobacter sp. SG-8]|uniref:Uncharacterized protein n=1 Tax=Marilutibacter penaei TaxID=2759900 RepID=A0A7W3U4G9_9GAMM|nr:hypothetical protein [Lysobacter penaei]MBB1088768.1 hypothetical protein [Lysobacter penaei]
MSNIVEFLESLGRNPALASSVDVEAAACAAGLDPETAKAVATGEANAIARLSAAPPIVFCGLFSPEEDAPAREDEPAEPDEAPDEEKASIAA